jgi:hypothetical protein
MKFSDWQKLTDNERDKMCQQLSPYDDRDLFKAVEVEFISQFGNQLGIGKVFCGLGAGLGPYNAITVEILPNSKRTKLPKRFLGFLLVKAYHRK